MSCLFASAPSSLRSPSFKPAKPTGGKKLCISPGIFGIFCHSWTNSTNDMLGPYYPWLCCNLRPDIPSFWRLSSRCVTHTVLWRYESRKLDTNSISWSCICICTQSPTLHRIAKLLGVIHVREISVPCFGFLLQTELHKHGFPALCCTVMCRW